MKREICGNGTDHLAELEYYDDGGPNVARLMIVGCNALPKSWTVDDIRFGNINININIPPSTLYDRFEGTTEECLAWIEAKGFNIDRMKVPA